MPPLSRGPVVPSGELLGTIDSILGEDVIPLVATITFAAGKGNDAEAEGETFEGQDEEVGGARTVGEDLVVGVTIVLVVVTLLVLVEEGLGNKGTLAEVLLFLLLFEVTTPEDRSETGGGGGGNAAYEPAGGVEMIGGSEIAGLDTEEPMEGLGDDG